MARDILSEYGKDSGAGNKPRATNGGHCVPRDVHNYEPPKGPMHIMNEGVGLRGGHNYGHAGSQGKSTLRGGGESGSPGIHGMNKGHGTNRG